MSWLHAPALQRNILPSPLGWLNYYKRMLKRCSKRRCFGYTKWFYGRWKEGLGLYWANESWEFQQWPFVWPQKMGSVKYCTQWPMLSVATSGRQDMSRVYTSHCSHHFHTSHWLTKVPQIIQHNPHIFFHCITNSTYLNHFSHLEDGGSMFLQHVEHLVTTYCRNPKHYQHLINYHENLNDFS